MDISKYQFTAGNGSLISTQPFLNGNSAGATGELITMAYGDLDHAQRLSLISGLNACAIVPGLYGRGPGSFDSVGGEDIFGLCSSSRQRAEEIHAYLSRYWGTYDVHKPNQVSLIDWQMFEWKKPWNIFKHWIGRHFGLIAHVKMCAGINPNWFYRWRWSADIKATAKNGTQDGIMHGYQSVLTYHAEPIDCRMMRDAYNKWVGAKIDVEKVYSAYIGDPLHPLCIAARSAKARVGF